MEENKHNLENKLIYRLIKVVYILAFLGACFIMVTLGWSEKPTQYVDSSKSYLACSNGKSYTLDSSKIYLFSEEKTLDKYNDEKARKVCAYEVVDDYLNSYKTPHSINYTINIENSTRGSWKNVILFWFLGISISYILLNLLRETLLYILFGKKLTWEWLTKIWDLLNSK